MQQNGRISTNGEAGHNGQRMETPAPEEIARRAGLRYVCDTEPGIHRRACGRGFCYLSPSGKRLTNARQIERIESLAIPPAWKDVWICRFAKGHLQATGRDSRDRKQYRYHDRWQEMTGRAKFSILPAFGDSLPGIRRRVARDLEGETLSWTRVAALAVSLLDETGMRIGNREYTMDNDSYGLTTLKSRHVQILDDRAVFSYKGKSGQKRRVELMNPRLVALISECKVIRGSTLLKYETERGWQPLTSYDVNSYLDAFSGDITAKTFRTWHGSKIVAECLFQCDLPRTVTARKKVISEAICTAAERLGNTPAICRNYYAHPRVLELFLEGKFPEVFAGFAPRRRKQITKPEQILLRILHHEAAALSV